MIGSIDANIRTYQAVVTNTYLGVVKHRAVISCVEIVSYMNVTAKVAMEVVSNRRIISIAAKQLFDCSKYLVLLDQC